ncbi:MAG: RES family NAD+ phosphorylase [Bacteriovorax sp.]|nr:RES family NAD+ phosphorylase [Bacteriovorax sp.]
MSKRKGHGLKSLKTFIEGREVVLRNGFRKLLPSQYVENEIKRITKFTDDQRQFWKDFQKYLLDEREKRIDDIIGSIDSTKVENLNCDFGRIVSSKFAADPLNGVGSVKLPPGGRFNIAQSSSFSSYFIGLYLAEDYETAFTEKYHRSTEEQSESDLKHFALQPNESFSFNRVRVNLENYIDLTNDNTLVAFTDVIKDIVVPDYYKNLGKKLKIELTMATDSEVVKSFFFNEHYPVWAAWLDQPAPSQLFGHYCKLAGVQGILYPSVRNKAKNNLVVFPDNMVESNSSLKLIDEVPYVSEDRRFIDKSNYQNFINLT